MQGNFVLTPREAAEAAKVSLPTIYEWCKRPGFPSFPVGGSNGKRSKILIPVDAFKRWLEAQAGGGC